MPAPQPPSPPRASLRSSVEDPPAGGRALLRDPRERGADAVRGQLGELAADIRHREAAKQRSTELPTTDRLADYGLMLPTYPQLSNDQVLFICARIREHGTGSNLHIPSKISGMQWLRAA